MPSTALIFLPVPGGNPSSSSSLANDTSTSPTSTLVTHISRTYTPKPLGPYALDHRLLVDTSSLLPGHTAPRRYTHFLTLLSQFPGKTFVGTSGATAAAAAAASDNSHPSGGGGDSTNGSTVKPTTNSSPAGLTIMTIPSHSDTLFPLLVQRMSPLWVPRQAHRIEGGASFEMTDWKVRIGELRISAGQGQGRVRGCVCEAEFLGGGDGDQEGMEGMARAFIEGLARDSSVAVDGIKVVGPVAGEGSELVRQYMDLLKFARS